MTAIDRKAVLNEEVARKFHRIVAIDVAQASATEAFFVEMTAAITTLANVLVDVAVGGVVSEFLQNAVVAERGDVAVDTAFCALTRAVDRATKLVGGELAVGVQTEKVEQGLPQIFVVDLFFLAGICIHGCTVLV